MGKCTVVSSQSKVFIEGLVTRLKADLGISQNDTADFLHIADSTSSIGIKQIRVLKVWAQTKPYSSKHKLAWIENAQLMTIEAQNSLLKLLEEPPVDVSIILSCDNYHKLLSTVNSRCQLVFDPQGQKVDKLARKTSHSVSTKLKEVEQLLNEKDKASRTEQIRGFLEQLLQASRNDLFHANSAQSVIRDIRLTHETLAALDKNASPRLALESLIVNLESYE